MAFIDSLSKVVIERGKASPSGQFKRLGHVFVELGLILLESQLVVSALVDNRRRYTFLV